MGSTPHRDEVVEHRCLEPACQSDPDTATNSQIVAPGPRGARRADCLSFGRPPVGGTMSRTESRARLNLKYSPPPDETTGVRGRCAQQSTNNPFLRGRLGVRKTRRKTRGQTLLCAAPYGVGLPWVQFPPGNWVALAGSYRSGGGGNGQTLLWEDSWEDSGGLPPKTWSSLNGNRITGKEPGSDPCETDPEGTRSRPSSATFKLTSTPA